MQRRQGPPLTLLQALRQAQELPLALPPQRLLPLAQPPVLARPQLQALLRTRLLAQRRELVLLPVLVHRPPLPLEVRLEPALPLQLALLQRLEMELPLALVLPPQ